mmetsp:Transcript_86836/g.245970  ORF Transcript_86836/g.245970 Transcript_86836/m.245970 type:complete len:196 (+) Transcript_86836:1156-1743(+)
MAAATSTCRQWQCQCPDHRRPPYHSLEEALVWAASLAASASALALRRHYTDHPYPPYLGTMAMASAVPLSRDPWDYPPSSVGAWTVAISGEVVVKPFTTELVALAIAAAAAAAASAPAPAGPPNLAVIGCSYASLSRLRLDGDLLVKHQNGKWVCLVSRRAFATADQVEKHVHQSPLYKAELTKAIAAGRVELIS